MVPTSASRGTLDEKTWLIGIVIKMLNCKKCDSNKIDIQIQDNHYLFKIKKYKFIINPQDLYGNIDDKLDSILIKIKEDIIKGFITIKDIKKLIPEGAILQLNIQCKKCNYKYDYTISFLLHKELKRILEYSFYSIEQNMFIDRIGNSCNFVSNHDISDDYFYIIKMILEKSDPYYIKLKRIYLVYKELPYYVGGGSFLEIGELIKVLSYSFIAMFLYDLLKFGLKYIIDNYNKGKLKKIASRSISKVKKRLKSFDISENDFRYFLNDKEIDKIIKSMPYAKKNKIIEELCIQYAINKKKELLEYFEKDK